MYKKVLRIVAGALQIQAGALWLIVLFVITDAFSGGYIDIACSVALIVEGIIVCANKLRKDSDVIVYGIVNLVTIVLQFVFDFYVGMGTIVMVLLLVSAIMFFISKPSKND